MECQAKSIMERCGCLPYYFPEFGEVWGNVTHLGHLDWADTTCNHTQWLCLATYTGNQKNLGSFVFSLILHIALGSLNSKSAFFLAQQL